MIIKLLGAQLSNFRWQNFGYAYERFVILGVALTGSYFFFPFEIQGAVLTR